MRLAKHLGRRRRCAWFVSIDTPCNYQVHYLIRDFYRTFELIQAEAVKSHPHHAGPECQVQCIPT
jgi:hypothetical protein